MKRRRNYDPFRFNSNVSGGTSSTGNRQNSSSNHHDATIQSYSSGDDEYDRSSSDSDDIPIEDNTFNRDDMIDQLLNTMQTKTPPPQPQQQQAAQPKSNAATARPVKVIEPPKRRVPLDDIFTSTENRIVNERVIPVWKDEEDESSTDNSSIDHETDADDSDSDSDILSSSKVASNAMVIAKPSSNDKMVATRDTGNLFDNIFSGLTGNDNPKHRSKNHHGHNYIETTKKKKKKKKKKMKFDSTGSCRCDHCENNRHGGKSVYDRNHRTECFMCAWGNLYHDGISTKHIKKMNKIMSNYGGCENMELAQQLVLYYRRKVYTKHSKKNGERLPMFTLAVALVHIENHVLSAKTFIVGSLRLFHQVRYVIANNLFDENGKHDRHDLNGLINVQKVITSTFNLDPKKMMFNFDEGREDMEKIGQNFRFMEQFKQRDDRIQKRLKQAKKKQKKSKRDENSSHDDDNDEFSI
jgi:hypothetical protein